MVTFLQDYFILHDTVLEKIGLGFRGEKVVTGIHYFPVQFVCNRGRELWQKPFSTKINWKVLEFKCWLHSELTIEFSDVFFAFKIYWHQGPLKEYNHPFEIIFNIPYVTEIVSFVQDFVLSEVSPESWSEQEPVSSCKNKYLWQPWGCLNLKKGIKIG